MMACDSEEGPSSFGGPLKRPIDIEDGESSSVKKARVSLPSEALAPAEDDKHELVFSANDEESTLVTNGDCLTVAEPESLATGIDSSADELDLRVSPGSTQELLNGSLDLTESVLTGSVNDSEVDDLLSSSEIEDPSQSEAADEEALLASPVRDTCINDDSECRDEDERLQDQELLANDPHDECKDFLDKDFSNDQCCDMESTALRTESLSECDDTKPVIDSVSVLSVENGETRDGSKNDVTATQPDVEDHVPEASSKDLCDESFHHSESIDPDKIHEGQDDGCEGGERSNDVNDEQLTEGGASINLDDEIEAPEDQQENSVVQGDLEGNARDGPSPVSSKESERTGKMSREKDASPANDDEVERSEDSNGHGALVIDEVSLDGSSMKLLDELTSSADASLSRNGSSHAGCQNDEVFLTNSPCPESMDMDIANKIEDDKNQEPHLKKLLSGPPNGPSKNFTLEGLPSKFAEEKAILGALRRMTRKELEEAILRKVAQSIADKNEVRSLLELVKKKTAELANFERKYQAMYKQMSDLAVVFKRYVNERKNNPNAPAPPTKITRGVGVQVKVDVTQPNPSTPTAQALQPQTRVPAEPASKRRGRPSGKRNAADSIQHGGQMRAPEPTSPTKTVQTPLTPISPRVPAIRAPSISNRTPPTTPASPARVQAPSVQIPARSPNRAPPTLPAPIAAPPRVSTVTAPNIIARQPRLPESARAPQTSTRAPMVSIPPELMERVVSANAASTVSVRAETAGRQQNGIIIPQRPPQAPPSHQQAYTMRQTPVVAKVTLPSNVTEMLEAQAAAQRAAAAQRPAVPQAAKQVSDDVIDLTDEDDTAISVVQRSSSITQTAKTVSSTLIAHNTVARKIASVPSMHPNTSQAQPSRGMAASSPQKHPSQSQHPAPLPPSPPNPRVALHLAPPPKPKVSLSRKGNGICITWNMDILAQHADIKLYHIYVYQESHLPPSTSLWKYIGEIQALPLPMACTLKQFTAGHRYHFAVKAKDKFDRFGVFSDVVSIVLTS